MKKNRLKTLGIILLVITLAATILTILVVAGLVHSTGSEENDVLKDSFSGILENAYVYEDDSARLIILYEGNRYVGQEYAKSDYAGVADVEIESGKVVKLYAKEDTIEGTLDSYSTGRVQISGYEALTFDQALPVYHVTKNTEGTTEVRQKQLGDLVVGNSKVTLVVADRKACALIQTQNMKPEQIRVLIKNKKDICYPELYIKSNHSYQVDERICEKDTVVGIKDVFDESADKTETIVEPGEGLLYLCDENGKQKGEGYEGKFLIRKAENGYVLVNELPVEDYLRYVLPSEMPIRFDYEALKAQAVCARTFAYVQMNSHEYAQYGANLDDSTAYQVYHAAKSYDITDQAVADTAGMVLTYEDQLIDCYYYSTSAGYSEDLEVWQKDSPNYLVAENHTGEADRNLAKKRNFHDFITKTPSGVDENSPYYRWDAELSNEKTVDPEFGKLKKLEVKRRSKSGYVLSLLAVFEKGERTYERENEIRFFLGDYLTRLQLADGSEKKASSVPSACFEITGSKDGIFCLRGGGFGHDIGMSQYGADAMGRDGKNWQEILNAYYRNAEIKNIFDVKEVQK